MNTSPSKPHSDLSPVETQDWGWFDYLSFWMSDVHSIGGYLLAGTLFGLGVPPLQVLAALIAGSVIVCVFCTLMAVPSQRFGVPFAVIVRASFGPHAAFIPAALRAFVAMAWYGIQTWLASNAIVVPLLRLFPLLKPYNDAQQFGFLGLSALGWACFLVLWAGQMALFRRGMTTIRYFFDFAGPAVYAVMILLLVDLLRLNHWHWPEHHAVFHKSNVLPGFGIMALVVSYFSAPMLNFGDFARNGRSMRQIGVGNILGAIVNFIAFSLLALATFTLTQPLFHAEIDDPVAIVSKLDSPVVFAIAIVTFLVSTAGINIAANLISGALDLCALAPETLNWNRAGWVCGIGAILITPWNLYNNPARMHATLDLFASAVGPLFGIVISDYFIRRRQVLVLEELTGGSGRVSAWPAIGALIIGACIAAVPELWPGLHGWANFSWFFGALAGAILYLTFSAIHVGTKVRQEQTG